MTISEMIDMVIMRILMVDPGSSEYDDPRDYREWDDWSDTDNVEQYWAPFPAEVGEDSVLTSCASMLCR